MAYLRHPKTRCEMSFSVDEMHKHFVRPGRAYRHLANEWDDKPCQRQRSWKKYRKIRYKSR